MNNEHHHQAAAMSFFQSFDLTLFQWIFIFATGLLAGMNKVGVVGATLLVIPFLALILGGKFSAGFVLPLLIAADIFAVIYYKRKCRWKILVSLLPWTVGGILIGVYLGNAISDLMFKRIMGVTLLIAVVFMLLRERRGKGEPVPANQVVSGFIGMLGGFSSMIGNVAGPLISLYLLSKRLPKTTFIGTMAWFFFIVNIVKVPFHVFIWRSITLESFLLNLLIVPFILLGAFLGLKIVHRIPEKGFRYFVFVMAGIGAVRLFF